MEFGFKLDQIFDIDKNGFIVLSGRTIQQSYQRSRQNYKEGAFEKVSLVLDRVGEASTKSQGLGSVITNFSRFSFSDHRLYIKTHNNSIIGFIKVGEKSLCYRQSNGKFLEMKPLCVLDFYVHESTQRHGYGKQIFEYMIENEHISPEKLAIDRPSFKFLSFLKKYFGLSKYSAQSNNFVIFDQFFNSNSHVDRRQQNPIVGRLTTEPVSQPSFNVT
jgi:alpha-tubulin N-acetyltransferase 1